MLIASRACPRICPGPGDPRGGPGAGQRQDRAVRQRSAVVRDHRRPPRGAALSSVPPARIRAGRVEGGQGLPGPVPDPLAGDVDPEAPLAAVDRQPGARYQIARATRCPSAVGRSGWNARPQAASARGRIQRDLAMGIGTPVRGPRRCGTSGGSPGLIAPRGVVKRETDCRVPGDPGRPRDAGHVARNQHGGSPSARSARLEVRGPPGLMDFPPDASHLTGYPGRGGTLSPSSNESWPCHPGRRTKR